MSQTWTLGVTARASKTSARTIRRWLDNGVITLRGDDIKADGSGTHCGMSRPRVLQTAMTRTLLNTGMSLSLAADAAWYFSDQEDSGRLRADLYEFGKTFLVIDSSGVRVVNADFDAELTEVSQRSEAAIILDCNKITARVDTVLYPITYTERL